MAGAFGGEPPTLHPMFNEVPPEAVAQAMAATPAGDGPVPDLFRWYVLDPSTMDAQSAATLLAELPFVTRAAVQGTAVVLATPHLNPQFVNQRYLLAAPEGIDAQYAWSKVGGEGAGVTIIDVEYGFWHDHEDLVNLPVQVLGGILEPQNDHGTAVLGILAAEDNTKGCIGIAPQATLAFTPLRRAPGPGIVNPNKNVANAIFRAIQHQQRNPDTPMVLLIEVGFSKDGSGKGDLPAETEIPVPDLIHMAIQNGITVVEGAGNGGLNLDDYERDGIKPLARATADSGAIIVAASMAGMSFSRRASSCYGSRVDCFAWGDSVRTCHIDIVPNMYFDFSGTSAATAIVAGAAALVQSIAVARTGARFSPKRVRELLTDPTLNTPSDAGQRIGVRPNLKAIIDSIPTGP